MNLERFKGRVALVTGAGRGIGEAAALRLAAEGCCVAVNDMDAQLCQSVTDRINAAGGSGYALACDVCNEEQARKMFARTVEVFGRIDILVNNAGITRDGTLRRLPMKKFDQVIAVNLRAPFFCMQEAARYMAEQGYGRIISMSSITGAAGNFGQSNYAATKAGLIGMSKTAALELGKYGITVNCVAPGFVDSEMTRAIPEDIRQAQIKKIPRGYPCSAEEIAGAIAYLASEEAGFVNGATLHINGGCYMV